MMIKPNYRKPFYIALSLHLFLAALLITDQTTKRPVLTAEKRNTPGMELPVVNTPEQEVVKAVSVDSKQIMDAVSKLKQERAQQKQAEINRQKQLDRQAELAKQQRIKEQQELARLKEEANKVAIARKKQEQEEKKRLKEIAQQKAIEAKQLAELKEKQQQLKKQQDIEEKRLAELNRKKQIEKAQQAQVAKAKEEQKRLAEAAAAKERAAQDAEKQARIAGEVNKYKALIVNAIGRHWILPENVDSSLSSQFRIRLAPDGMVLEVTLLRSSGDPILDRSAQTAIHKASPLPVPSDTETFNLFRNISLTVRPEQVRG